MAAETAIGNYPIQCVRIISNIIKEFSNAQFSVNGSFNDQSVEYLFSQPAYFTISPHGDNDLVNQEIINNRNQYYVKSKTEKKLVPNFLIDKENDNFSNDDLLKGLKLVSDYMEKSILKPNNINYPVARLDFFNNLKNL